MGKSVSGQRLLRSLLLPQPSALGLAGGRYHSGPLPYGFLLGSANERRQVDFRGRGERGQCVSSLPQQRVSAGGCVPSNESVALVLRDTVSSPFSASLRSGNTSPLLLSQRISLSLTLFYLLRSNFVSESHILLGS